MTPRHRERPPTANPAGSGIPDEPLDDADTGRIGRVAYARLAGKAGRAGPADGGPDVENFMDIFATKLASRVGAPARGHTFLGIEASGWTKMLVAYTIGAVVALAAWYLTVRDSLRDRPTIPIVQEVVQDTFDAHNDSSAAHPQFKTRIEAITVEQRLIRDSQIKQATTDEIQTKTLERIEGKLGRR